jgi:hypothetical protein
MDEQYDDEALGEGNFPIDFSTLVTASNTF